MIKGVTPSGFAYELSDAVQNNWELIEVLQDIDNGKDGRVVDMAKMILGEDQYKALKEYIRGEDGIVKADQMANEIVSVFNSIKNAKNSSSSQ